MPVNIILDQFLSSPRFRHPLFERRQRDYYPEKVFLRKTWGNRLSFTYFEGNVYQPAALAEIQAGAEREKLLSHRFTVNLERICAAGITHSQWNFAIKGALVSTSGQKLVSHAEAPLIRRT